MRAADQDPLQPLRSYLINRHESYSALVFLNYMKNANKGKSEYLGSRTKRIGEGRVMVSAIFLFIWGDQWHWSVSLESIGFAWGK